MSRGQLLAVGSSNFIKKRFGEGYNLKISFNNSNLKNKISEIVNEKILDCLLETQHSNEN
jgi:ATP-binding cassette subfamily A (ABC1) protein 3